MQCMKKVRSRGSGIREWELGLSKLRSALRWQQLEVHVERWLRVCPKELVTGSMGGRGVRGLLCADCWSLWRNCDGYKLLRPQVHKAVGGRMVKCCCLRVIRRLLSIEPRKDGTAHRSFGWLVGEAPLEASVEGARRYLKIRFSDMPRGLRDDDAYLPFAISRSYQCFLLSGMLASKGIRMRDVRCALTGPQRSTSAWPRASKRWSALSQLHVFDISRLFRS